MKSSLCFGDIVKELKSVGGFPARDILPIIPPGARIGEGSQIKPEQIGKIPGKYRSGEWVGLPGSWPTFGMSERDQTIAAMWPTQNVGLRAADFPAIDCDTNSPEALALVENLVFGSFNDGLPVRERGNAPRALYPFRRSGEASIRKHRIEFVCDKNKKHAVEVLALGQQYVISGIHPTGVAFEWRERQGENGPTPGDLVSYRASGLTPITAEDVTVFITNLKDAIEAKGWTVTKTLWPRQGSGAANARVVVRDADPFVDDTSVALSALQAIPNTIDTLPTREDLVSLIASFKHAVGFHADSMYPDVVTWATEHGWADEGYLKKIWDSLTTTTTPPEHLFYMARKYGWRGDTLLDFQDHSTEDGMTVDERIQHAQEASKEEDQKLRDLASNLAYITKDQLFVHLGTGDLLTAEALNNSPGFGTTVSAAGSSGLKTTSNRLRNSGGLLRLVNGVVYLPGKSRITPWEREGFKGVYFNRWHAPIVALPDSVSDEDVKPWLDHAEYLFPVAAEREYLYDFLAHIIQKRGEKIRFAPLVIGAQGTGKDLFIKPVLMYLGHNARDLKPEQMTARFNDFLENELLVVQELKKTNRNFDFYERAKPLLAGTAADTHYIEKKFQPPYAVPNIVNFFLFSNHIDCLELDPDDRRLLVMHSPVTKREYSYYKNLAEVFYRQQSGWRKVIRWLLQRDISKFDANDAPIATSGRALLISSQKTLVRSALEEAIATGCYKDRKCLTGREVFEAMKFDFNFRGMDSQARADLKTTAQVVNEFIRIGWKSYDKPLTLKGGKQIRVWYRPTVEPDAKTFRLDYEAAHATDAFD